MARIPLYLSSRSALTVEEWEAREKALRASPVPALPRKDLRPGRASEYIWSRVADPGETVIEAGARRYAREGVASRLLLHYGNPERAYDMVAKSAGPST